MKKAIKEIDFSRGIRGKYAGKTIRVVGDRKQFRRINSSEIVWEFVNTRKGTSFDVAAATRAEARQRFLELFNLERMPAGIIIQLKAA